MHALLLTCCLLAATLADHEADWDMFKTRFGRTYSDAEERHRFRVFVENMHEAQALNDRFPLATFGVTKFSDLSADEFRAKYLRTRRAVSGARGAAPSAVPDYLPTVFDWRDFGVLNPPTDQGDCGSCWAFSVTALVEASTAIHSGALFKLSEQQLVDCDAMNNGCEGGMEIDAADYIADTGLVLRADYPYMGVEGTCTDGDAAARAMLTTWGTLDDEGLSVAALNAHGPMSFGIDATVLKSYTSGVITADMCASNEQNHGVVAVGYDLDAATPQWTFRNSWGPDWGEDGYFRIEYGANACAIRDLAMWGDAASAAALAAEGAARISPTLELALLITACVLAVIALVLAAVALVRARRESAGAIIPSVSFAD